MSTETTFHELPVAALRESPMNPRKHFDSAKLAELTASVKANGVRTPLLVRPIGGGHYEIGAGHRRYRSARAAGLETVPALVRMMEDAEFLELLNFENLEREDVHPLEEAEGYDTLMKKAGHDVESIAARIGKSVKYVYDRVKLLQLAAPARKLFLEGQIAAGHAILLARLSPKDQVRCIGTKDDDYRDGGLLEDERTLWDPDEQDEIKATYKARSVRELEAWIDEHVKFDKAAADPVLFPDTAATVQRAASQKEKIVQITHDHMVRPEARDEKERIYGPRSWKDARDKSCPKVLTGVIVVGPGRGDALKVCINKECKVHFAAEIKERERNRQLREKHGGAERGAATSKRAEREEQERQRRQEQEEARRSTWRRAMPQILEAVAAAVETMSVKPTGELARLVLRACRPYEPVDPSKYLGALKTADDVVRWGAFLQLGRAAKDYNAVSNFPKVAKSLGVDVGKILKAAASDKAKAAEKK